jgi:VIT1/CCC1 family predicted Fe2+/Mn2+ transporter
MHRDVRGGGLRAAVFGVSDGLVSNVSLVLGTAGAHPGVGVVRLAGLAGLFGGSFSMAAGEYVSMRAQQEAYQRELDVERRELRERPEFERRELERIYTDRGIAPDVAASLAEAFMANPELALDTHAREELGIDPDALGMPLQSGFVSFFTFAVGAFMSLIPFLGGTSGTKAIIASIIITAIAALGVGSTLSVFTRRPMLFSAVRSLAICAVAGAITYGIGTAIGVASS